MDRKENIIAALRGEENYFLNTYSEGKLKQIQRRMKKEDGIPLTNEEKQEAKEWRRERMQAAAEGSEKHYFSKKFSVEELKKKLADTTTGEGNIITSEPNRDLITTLESEGEGEEGEGEGVDEEGNEEGEEGEGEGVEEEEEQEIKFILGSLLR